MRWQLDSLERRAIDAVRQHARDGRLPGSARTLSLDADEYHALCKVLNIGHQQSDESAHDENQLPLLPQLIALLWSHRVSDLPVTRAMAGTIASACFGERHLWQDIGLAGRPEVSTLLERHFNKLAAGNTRGLKWKRYLFLRLGERLAISDLRPPRCQSCDEFPVCFPPQTADGVTVVRSSDGQNSQST